MKKITFILLSLFLCVSYMNAQNKAEAKFQNPVHDFGKIAEEVGTATCEFVFTNTGNAPLIVNRVAASCGCTTPKRPEEPILPGKTGKITVSYSTTGRVGAFSKPIRVFTNVPDSVYTLTIKGEVLPKK